jgi:hypothetical protein
LAVIIKSLAGIVAGTGLSHPLNVYHSLVGSDGAEMASP